MRIEIVQLENIRSHVKSTVPFARGFNCLLGGVGCGKSTILYSIDFAFFGESIGRGFDYLLREGSTNGKVKVQFSHNGKSYTISRGLKRYGKGINQNFDELKLFEEETLLSSGKGDAVAEQFKAITGLNRELFREIVWVRQEHLKELLNLPPRERQRRLDELFGLADYELAWTSLAGYQREFDGEKRAYEKDPDVVNIEKLGNEYNKIADEFSLVEIQLQEMTQRLSSAKKTLEEADLRLQKVEETRRQNEELKRKEAKTHANFLNIQDSIASLTEKVNGKKTSIENLNQRFANVEAQLLSCRAELKELGFPCDQPIEVSKKSIAALDDEISNLKGEQEANLRSIRLDEGKINSISLENRCPLCLQPLTKEYKAELADRIQAENSGRRKAADELRAKIEELQRLKTNVSNAFSILQALDPRTEELKNRIKEEADSLTELLTEFDDKQRLEKDLRTQLDTVRYELKKYDSSEIETTKKVKEQAFRQYYVLESELHARESRKKDLTLRLDETKERIDQAQQKVERMQKTMKAIELLAGIRDAYRGIQPKLRSEFVKVLRNFAQQVLDNLIAGEAPMLNLVIDETYTPYVLREDNTEREVANLSGGERTMLAFAYRLGLGQLIMQSRTGHSLNMLLLDEPTESLGTEDGSINRLAEAISSFKAIEQTIAVTHSEAFAEKAEHVIRVNRESQGSKVLVER